MGEHKDMPDRVHLERIDLRNLCNDGESVMVGVTLEQSPPPQDWTAYVRADLAQPVYPAAVVQRLVEALGLLKHVDGCYCDAAFAGPDTVVRHSPECEAATAALDEARRVGKNTQETQQ